MRISFRLYDDAILIEGRDGLYGFGHQPIGIRGQYIQVYKEPMNI